MKSLALILSISFLFAGCEVLNMPKKMDAANEGVEKTNSKMQTLLGLAYEQKLAITLEMMLRPENTRDLEPIALGMMGGAEKFAEAATTDDLIKFTYVLLQQIRDERPTTGNEDYYDHDKMIKFSQIVTLAGLAPEKKVDQIIEEQILNGGQYNKEAYAFLMARAFFLGTYLAEKMLSVPVDTVGKMDETIKKLASIDKILKLYQVDPALKTNIALEAVGFVKRDPIVVTLYNEEGAISDERWNAPVLWKKVLKKFDRDLKDGNVIAASSSKNSATQAKINQMKAEVQSYINSWQ